MDTFKRSTTLGTVICRFIAVATILVLATLVLSEGALAQAKQPKLKEILGKTSEEEEAKEEAKEEQEPETAKPKDVRPVIPDDEFDRGTPRRAVEGFLKATGEGNYERATQYLELSSLAWGLARRGGVQLARELRIVLDRALWVDYDLLSDSPRGYPDDGLSWDRDRLGRIETPEKNYDILLEQVLREDGVYIWKFSSATVAQIPRLYAHFGYGPVGEALSTMFPEAQFLGLKVWQWVALLVFAALAYLAALVVTGVAAFFLRRKETELRYLIARLVAGPLRFLIVILIVRFGIDLVHPSVEARAVAERIGLDVSQPRQVLALGRFDPRCDRGTQALLGRNGTAGNHQYGDAYQGSLAYEEEERWRAGRHGTSSGCSKLSSSARASSARSAGTRTDAPRTRLKTPPPKGPRGNRPIAWSPWTI